ncbi:ubiquinol-cytochrome c reductase cytochrome b subunit [Streptomyces sp. SLBN-118]|uniref:cytochrome b N-terminal domain-containing protein n=1 Tax=Streptomyces sp. SLBN-118 TaxID=2768454 RepID=UPI00114F0478|nr:cytochrome b N-terminal domain-containing protein [Streptomyces sp. SLBN-118]TQK45147.1 ubiquinol-cytochrome c reductase cytochrome b subunit [Streptomyces sp. SLBN-118]
MTSTSPTPTPPAGAQPGRRGWFHRAVDAIDERMGIKALTYPVPEHANNLAWSLGGITAVAFVILLVTGIYITQFYAPIPEDANQSVRDLVTDVWLGSFARGLHYWAAQAMFVLALLHLLRVFFHASYKKPREGNWVVGAAMFLLTFLAVFTGTVLKWDQEGYEAMIHNLDVAELLGGAGIWFTDELTDRVSILLRLFNAHVVIVPGLILLLFVWHALLIKRHKISSHPEIPVAGVESAEPFTTHLQRVAAFGLVLLGALSLLGVLVPPVVGPTPVDGIEITRPLWMFWWFFPMEEWFGVASIGWVILGVFGLTFLVPFLDRSPRRRWRERKVTVGVAVVLLLALAAITIQVWIANPKGH